MSKHSFTVIVVTARGTHLTAHQSKRWAEVREFMREKLSQKLAIPYVNFLVIITKDDGFSTTTCHHLTPSAARRLLEKKDHERSHDKNRRLHQRTRYSYVNDR